MMGSEKDYQEWLNEDTVCPICNEAVCECCLLCSAKDKVIDQLKEALQEVIDFTPNDTDYPEKPTRDECIDEIKYFARAALNAAEKAGEE